MSPVGGAMSSALEPREVDVELEDDGVEVERDVDVDDPPNRPPRPLDDEPLVELGVGAPEECRCGSTIVKPPSSELVADADDVADVELLEDVALDVLGAAVLDAVEVADADDEVELLVGDAVLDALLVDSFDPGSVVCDGNDDDGEAVVLGVALAVAAAFFTASSNAAWNAGRTPSLKFTVFVAAS